jgi:hypothetical protein
MIYDMETLDVFYLRHHDGDMVGLISLPAMSHTEVNPAGPMRRTFKVAGRECRSA